MIKIEDIQVIKKEDIAPLFPPLKDDINKGDLGRLVIAGGSKNYVGAPLLAEMGAAAMSVGNGTNVLAVPSFLLQPLYKKVILSSLFALCDDTNAIVFKKSEFDELKGRATAFAVGMGMGNGDALSIIEYLLNETILNFVLDADALRVAKDIADFKNRAVLTPHILEFSRITGYSKEEIISNAPYLAKQFAKEKKCVLVLKSHNSVVTDGEKVFINKTGNSRLAKGGSGDVLSGILGGLIARKVNAFEAAKAACYILGRCAELSTVNEYSHQATDTVTLIPKVIDELIG